MLADRRGRALRMALSVAAAVGFFTTAGSQLAWTQDMSTGALNISVQDPAGAVVNGAQLVLKDVDTNDVHTATTKGDGNAVLSFLKVRGVEK